MEHRKRDAQEGYGKGVLVSAGRKRASDGLGKADRKKSGETERKQVAEQQYRYRPPRATGRFEARDLRLFAGENGATARQALVVRNLQLFDERLRNGPLVARPHLDEDATNLPALLLLQAEPGTKIFRLDVATAKQDLANLVAALFSSPIESRFARSRSADADGAF
jgi:hypothetical protein